MAEATDVQRRTSVFIVGGGPVGLAMGLLLDRFGIDAVIVEKSPTDRPSKSVAAGCAPWRSSASGDRAGIRDRGLQENSDMFVQVEASPARDRPLAARAQSGQTPA